MMKTFVPPFRPKAPEAALLAQAYSFLLQAGPRGETPAELATAAAAAAWWTDQLAAADAGHLAITAELTGPHLAALVAFLQPAGPGPSIAREPAARLLVDQLRAQRQVLFQLIEASARAERRLLELQAPAAADELTSFLPAAIVAGDADAAHQLRTA